MALVRDQTFQLRLTAEEKRMLEQIAERSGVSASDWVRLAIRQASVSLPAQQEATSHGHPAHRRRSR